MEQNNYQNYELNEISKWNWGAFLLSIPWGFGNKTYLPLLTLIPVFGFFWMFVCGLKGNEWAWRNNQYRDIEEFNRVQETWNRAGLVMIIVYVALILFFVLFFGIIASMFAIGMGNSYYYN